MGDKDKKLGDAVEIGSVALVGGAGAVLPGVIAAAPPAIIVFTIGAATAGIIQGIPKIREMFADSTSEVELQWTDDAKNELLEKCLNQVAEKHDEPGLLGFKNNAWDALKDYSVKVSDILENGLDLQTEIDSVFSQWIKSAELEYPYTADEVNIMKDIIDCYIQSMILLESKKSNNIVLNVLKTGEMYAELMRIRPEFKSYIDDLEKKLNDICDQLEEPKRKKIKKRELYYQQQVEEFERAEQTFLGNESLKDSYIEPRASIQDDIFLKDVVKDFYIQTEYGVLLLIGQPGDGKTSFCRKMVYDYAVDNPERSIEAKVLQFPLNQAKSGIINFSEGNIDITKAFHIEGESASLLDLEDCEGKLIILDGYDEVQYLLDQHTDYDTYKKFREYLLKIAKRYKIHFLITSRKNAIDDTEIMYCEIAMKTAFFPDSENDYVPNFLKNQDYSMACEFAPLSYDEQKNWCISRKPELWNDLDRICIGKYLTEAEESVYKLIQLPFIFRMVVEHEYTISDKVKNRAGLFEDLFEKTMERSEHHKEEKEQFDSGKLLDEYMKLAFRIWCNDENSAELLIDDDALSPEEKIKKKHTLTQILKLAYYIQEDSENGRLCFMHKSFYEYYLALFLWVKYSECNSEENVRAFFGYLAERRISFDILELLEEIAENHEDISDKVNKDIVCHVVDETDFIGLDTEKYKCAGDKRKIVRCNNIFSNSVGICSAIGNSDLSFDIFKRCYSYYSCDRLRFGNKKQIEYESDLNIRNTDISKSIFDNVDFRGKWAFYQSDLQDCSFENATILDINFENCHLEGTIFNDAIMDYGRIFRERILGCRFNGTQAYHAEIEHSTFHECDGEEVRFNDASISYSGFEYCKLPGARFKNACLTNVTFKGSDLRNSHFERARMKGVRFNEVKLDGAFFSKKEKKYLQTYLSADQLRTIHFV